MEKYTFQFQRHFVFSQKKSDIYSKIQQHTSLTQQFLPGAVLKKKEQQTNT